MVLPGSSQTLVWSLEPLAPTAATPHLRDPRSQRELQTGGLRGEGRAEEALPGEGEVALELVQGMELRSAPPDGAAEPKDARL